MSAEPLVITVEEAAGLLGILRGLAYELVRGGELPSLRLGRRLVVPRQRLLGLHTGEAVQRDGDDLGTTVNRAAGIMGVARGGEILA